MKTDIKKDSEGNLRTRDLTLEVGNSSTNGVKAKSWDKATIERAVKSIEENIRLLEEEDAPRH